MTRHTPLVASRATKPKRTAGTNMPDERTCSRPKCGNKPKRHSSSGLCEKHYELTEWKPYMPAKPVAEHIRLLEHHGRSKWQIEVESGVSHDVLWMIKSGRRQQVQWKTYRAILSIPITEAVSEAGYIPALGIRRRIQALMFVGWNQQEIAAEAGLPWRAVSKLLRQELVFAGTATAITTAFDRMLWKPMPDAEHWTHKRTRASARRSGYRAAADWDDIDSPDETPTPHRTLSTVEWHQELAGELSDTEIARELGIKPESLKRTIERALERAS